MTPLIFFGSDQYSATVLSHLLTANSLLLTAVVTDRHTDPSPVEKLSKTHNLKVAYYPDFDHSLITKDTLGLCASFDHLIPQEIIAKFGGHLYNLHPSLLPQYRNVSPIQYALALGDQTTGITLFRISPGIDDGEIIAQSEAQILPDDTTVGLTPRLFTLGAELFLRFLGSDLEGSAQPRPNNLRGRSDPMGTLIFTRRLKRESGYIEWSVLHKLLQNQVVAVGESTNELLNLRLQKESTSLDFGAWNLVLSDLCRSLHPWPTVWSTVLTKKGELRVTLESVIPKIHLKIAGKPKPISYSDFIKYYLIKKTTTP